MKTYVDGGLAECVLTLNNEIESLERQREAADAVIEAAKRWYEVQRGTMAAQTPSGLAVAAALKALVER